MDRSRLFLNHDADYDWLIALEFGCVDDGVPNENWFGIHEDFAYLLDRPVEGRTLGFRVNNFSEFDADDAGRRIIWGRPRFDAPVLGMVDVSAGEIVVAARAFFAGTSSINRIYFHAAVGSDDLEEAAGLWKRCLQAGDCMAHYGLGYTLHDLGEHHAAYRHLRAYAELVPSNEWAWYWLGKACEALGETGEAQAAYRRAVEIEERDDADDTGASERLEALG